METRLRIEASGNVAERQKVFVLSVRTLLAFLTMKNLLPNIIRRPLKIPGRRWMTRASVAIILRKNQANDFDVLLIKRAERIGDPWSGDMAFPGGKMDRSDQSIYHAALRELHEEIGLEAAKLKHIGRLSDQLTKTHSGLRPMTISPFVFELTTPTEFTLNHEVAEIVWIPLTHFSTPINRKQMVWKVKGMKLNLPCYWFDDKRVWGITLRILDELVGNGK